MSANSPQVTTSTGRVLSFDPTQLSPNALLKEALERPGILSTAYSRFHEYSLGNRLAVIIQCMLRKIEPGPFAAYAAWQKLDRQVRRGEKALFIMHPMMRTETDEATGKKQDVLVGFTWKPTAFVIAQTEGEDLELAEQVPFDLLETLKAPKIEIVPFDMADGNALGFAKPGRKVAVSKVSPRPSRTLMHEIGHVILGHCDKAEIVDGAELTRSTQEVEAESFSYIVCAMLNMGGTDDEAAESRGYIRSWMESGGKDGWTDANSRRVFSAVDRFLSLTKKRASTTEVAA